MHAHVCVILHVYMCIYIYTHIHTHNVYIQIYRDVYVCMHVCARNVDTSLHIYIYIYTYICTYVYTHTYMHVHMWAYGHVCTEINIYVDATIPIACGHVPTSGSYRRSHQHPARPIVRNQYEEPEILDCDVLLNTRFTLLGL